MVVLSALAITNIQSASAIEKGGIVGGTAPGGWGTSKAQIWIKGNPNRYICTGSVINTTKIITAAHCFGGRPDSQFFVRTGNVTLGNGYFYNILNRDERYDLAIVNTDGKLVTNASGRANIWAKAQYRQGVPNLKDQLDIFGWGRTCGTCDGPAQTLKTARVSIKDREVKDFRGGPAFLTRGINGRMWQGDSGGPVSVVRNGHEILFGINSSVGKGTSPFVDQKHSALTGENLRWAESHGLTTWGRDEL
jgi:hypothetical protein